MYSPMCVWLCEKHAVHDFFYKYKRKAYLILYSYPFWAAAHAFSRHHGKAEATSDFRFAALHPFQPYLVTIIQTQLRSVPAFPS